VIRVGFIGAVSREWIGGLNYYKNLLFALRAHEADAVEPIVFLGARSEPYQKELFREGARVVEHSLFDQGTAPNLVDRALLRVAGVRLGLEALLDAHGVDVLSHSNIPGLVTRPTVSWIPDFQHRHLPHLFTREQLSWRDAHFTRLAERSSAIVVSSLAAARDLEAFAPRWAHKCRVLPFVSQPIPGYAGLGAPDEAAVRGAYAIDGPFFYLPNQFWAHKNHLVAFEAVRLLKARGRKVRLVCTGHLEDYRNRGFVEELGRFVGAHGLRDEIRLLGLVPYDDVFKLMRFSVAVLNPSLFEGWSSTVEECKSVGKPMILSDLDVHREQYPEAAFFPRDDPEALAALLARDGFEARPAEDVRERTRRFAAGFRAILEECAGRSMR
jgi:glycosyltransferase involved in cell wall biosynthesis